MRSIKAILICALILLNSGFIFAQTTKGTFLLGELSIIDLCKQKLTMQENGK